ncbi:MAG: GtrA family protein [bacterium]
MKIFNKKFILFCISGGSGYVGNAISLYILSLYIHSEIIVWILATLVALCIVFTLNTLLTFSHVQHNSIRDLYKRFTVFLGSSTGAFIIQSTTGPLLVHFLGNNYRQYILAGVIVCFVAPYNWYMYNRVVWKK